PLGLLTPGCILKYLFRDSTIRGALLFRRDALGEAMPENSTSQTGPRERSSNTPLTASSRFSLAMPEHQISSPSRQTSLPAQNICRFWLTYSFLRNLVCAFHASENGCRLLRLTAFCD